MYSHVCTENDFGRLANNMLITGNVQKWYIFNKKLIINWKESFKITNAFALNGMKANKKFILNLQSL